MQVFDSYTIDNITLTKQGLKLILNVTEESNVISLFIILRFYLRNNEITKLNLIIEDRFGAISTSMQNQYQIQDFSLNSFLFYYSTQKLVKSINFKSGDTTNYREIIGWEISFSETFYLYKHDLKLIQRKIKVCRDSKKEKIKV